MAPRLGHGRRPARLMPKAVLDRSARIECPNSTIPKLIPRRALEGKRLVVSAEMNLGCKDQNSGAAQLTSLSLAASLALDTSTRETAKSHVFKQLREAKLPKASPKRTAPRYFDLASLFSSNMDYLHTKEVDKTSGKPQAKFHSRVINWING